MWQQQQDQYVGKMTYYIGQEDYLHVGIPHEEDRSFDAVRVKYINLNGIKSAIFTKPESITYQRQTHIV